MGYRIRIGILPGNGEKVKDPGAAGASPDLLSYLNLFIITIIRKSDYRGLFFVGFAIATFEVAFHFLVALHLFVAFTIAFLFVAVAFVHFLDGRVDIEVFEELSVLVSAQNAFNFAEIVGKHVLYEEGAGFAVHLLVGVLLAGCLKGSAGSGDLLESCLLLLGEIQIGEEVFAALFLFAFAASAFLFAIFLIAFFVAFLATFFFVACLILFCGVMSESGGHTN